MHQESLSCGLVKDGSNAKDFVTMKKDDVKNW